MEDIYARKPWLKSYDKNVAPSLTYEDKTFAQKFREAVNSYPEKTALIYMGTKITFRELDLMSNQVAHFLIKSGLRPGDVVGLHMLNIPANFITTVGVQKAGCISTGLSPLLTPHEMEHQINDSGVKIIFTLDVLFSKIAEVAAKTGFSTVVVSEIADFLPAIKGILGKLLKKIPTAEVKPLQGKTVKRFTELLAQMPKERIEIKRSINDIIFMMYTGGTTGPSKGALLSQRAFMSNGLQVLTWLDITPEDVALSALPLFHIGGLAFGCFTMTKGVTQICIPNPRDTHFLTGCIKAYNPTVVVNVPTVYFELMKRPEFRSMNLSRIKWCISAGAPFPSDYIDELESILGKSKFIELYGMTETSPITCGNPRYGVKKPGSIGIPLPDTEYKLTDPETGKYVKPGEPGEIIVRGPQLMDGYHNNPEETATAMRDGWMHTGDVATMDKDGYFYVVDRIKDMVIVSGFKVFTRELDDVLMKHPDVEIAASIGIPDPKRPGSERVGCALVLRPGIEKGEEEKQKILAYLKENVAPYKVPKVIEFMDQLPTSGVGKVLKREVKKMMVSTA